MPTISNLGTVPNERKWSAARIYQGFAGLLERLQPLAGVAMRLYVGNVFLVSGWLKLSRWDSTIARSSAPSSFCNCLRSFSQSARRRSITPKNSAAAAL